MSLGGLPEDVVTVVRSLLFGLIGAGEVMVLSRKWRRDALRRRITSLHVSADAPLRAILAAVRQRPTLQYLDLNSCRAIDSDAAVKQVVQALQDAGTKLRAICLAGCGAEGSLQQRGFARQSLRTMKSLGIKAWAFPARAVEKGCVLVSFQKGPADELASRYDVLQPHLSRAVVLVLSHNSGGTTGIILNKRSPLRLRSPPPAAQQIKDMASMWPAYFGDSEVFLGGDSGDKVTMLHGHKELGGVEVVSGIYADQGPEEIERACRGVMRNKYAAGSFRWLMGMCSWPPGLLSQEICAQKWCIAMCDGCFLLPEGGRPEDMWSDLWTLVH
mmetsp:Transcript_160591/g.283158  ORF Transcript_160591/g.283158 Transcript_160591/m.283158 type:complete len:329 (+) Transcript_160591:45-1031(+)